MRHRIRDEQIVLARGANTALLQSSGAPQPQACFACLLTEPQHMPQGSQASLRQPPNLGARDTAARRVLGASRLCAQGCSALERGDSFNGIGGGVSSAKR